MTQLKSAAKPTPVQCSWLARGLDQAGGKLPLFDRVGQRIDPRTIQSCIEQGWAEPWFSNPLKPDWLVCRLTAAGRAVLERRGPPPSEWRVGEEERPAPVRAESTLMEMAGKTILIVDADAASVELYRAVLAPTGASVIQAGNGLQALRLACERKPDLIVTDIRLPLLSGLEVIRQIRNQPAFGHVAIIVVTAVTSPEYRRLCEEAGSEAFLAKPISVVAFLETVRECLNPSGLKQSHG
ncbi:MAG: response regulator [Alphaproteobacteria bacterium]